MCYGESIRLLAQPVIGGDSSNGKSLSLGRFRFAAGELRAFLATGVLTMAADPVGAECRLAAMAGAMDPHANLLLHSGHSFRGRHRPLSNLQCQSVFRKESARLLFLDCVALFGGHGAFGFASRGRGPVFLDDLRDASRD